MSNTVSITPAPVTSLPVPSPSCLTATTARRNRLSIATEIAATDALMALSSGVNALISAPANAVTPFAFVRVGTTTAQYVASVPWRVGMALVGPPFCVVTGLGLIAATLPLAIWGALKGATYPDYYAQKLDMWS